MRTLADVVGHLGESGKTAILDATAIRVRRPARVTDGRDRFVSGKSKQNATKAMVLTDAAGRLLFCGETRPGACPDITQARESGLVGLLDTGPCVEVLADAGYQGLGGQTGGQVVTPPHRKSRTNPPPWYEEIHTQAKHAHPSRRIRVEHGIAHLKNWRCLARHHGRREQLPETVQAVAALVSHQQSATRPLTHAA
ncbi:transposase family protein [Streptomyces sp. NPDC052396]|uniref:transposase family protein n=1 Tax=Streptomyces sp. NPDC052396 TaxID=3365689 RepID=UPI0037D0A8F7